MRVELGAGTRARPGYLALDVNPRAADVIGSAQALPFRDASIEALIAIDVLEHLSYRVTDAALREWARVLTPGGTLFVQVPDADGIMHRYVRHDLERLRSPAELPDTALAGAAWRLLGGHADGRYVDAEGDWRWNAHYSLWSRDALHDALHDAGLRVRDIEINDHPNLRANAVKAR